MMSDDHTSQAWGIYGGVLEKYAINKNIKRLAAKGVVLENAFCTNSICVPSRASILTGQYSHKNQVYTLTDALEPDKLNVAKILRKFGYQTALVGKWHLKKQPSGFDYFNVLPGQGRYNNPLLNSPSSLNLMSLTATVFKYLLRLIYFILLLPTIPKPAIPTLNFFIVML